MYVLGSGVYARVNPDFLPTLPFDVGNCDVQKWLVTIVTLCTAYHIKWELWLDWIKHGPIQPKERHWMSGCGWNKFCLPFLFPFLGSGR